MSEVVQYWYVRENSHPNPDTLGWLPFVWMREFMAQNLLVKKGRTLCAPTTIEQATRIHAEYQLIPTQDKDRIFFPTIHKVVSPKFNSHSV